MIRVLQDWEEIGAARNAIAESDLPGHGVPEKNWDMQVLREIINGRPKPGSSVDLGCSGLYTLDLLHAMGLRHLLGVDLGIPLRTRWPVLKRTIRQRERPYRLLRRDLTNTGLAAESAGLVTCVSVIEHGVDYGAFIRESERLLHAGGILFVTTDYWPEPINTCDVRAWGLRWTVATQDDLRRLVELANQAGLDLLEGSGVIPECKDRTVYWHGRRYTFVAIAFKKRPRG